jgi:hypothetical protein
MRCNNHKLNEHQKHVYCHFLHLFKRQIASYYPFLHSLPVVVKSLLPDCPIPWGRIMVYNATFNSNPAISWHSVLLVEEI